MKINPMLKKEITVSVRGIRLTVLMLIFNIILALIGLAVFHSILDNARYFGTIDYGSSISLYVTLVFFQFLLLAFIVPAITASAISGERERQTLDILLSTSLTPAKIIFGKLFSSLTSVVLLIISSIPIMSLIFIFGGVAVGDLIITILFLIFIAVYAGSIGIACSTRFKKTTSSTVASYGIVLAIGFGTIFLVGMITLFSVSSYSYESSNGIFSLILLLNPVITLMGLLMHQVGGFSDISYMMSAFGMPDFISEHVVIISFLCQALFIVFLLWASIRRLNPIKKKVKR